MLESKMFKMTRPYVVYIPAPSYPKYSSKSNSNNTLCNHFPITGIQRKYERHNLFGIFDKMKTDSNPVLNLHIA